VKKLVILIIGVLAACIAVVAVMGTRSVDAGGPRIDTYKCYKARHAKRTPRFQSERVFLTDQFRDNIEVSVLKLNTHCAAADQELYYDGTAAGFGPGLDCYTIRDAPRQERFTSQNIEVRDKLTNWGEQVLTVSKLSSLCTESFKDQKFKGPLEGSSFVCYQAKTAKGQPRFQQRDMTIDDQFGGTKEVRVIRPVAYCSGSEKKSAAQNDDFEDAQYYDYYELYDGRLEDHTSTVHATLENNDPIISCKTDYSHSVWYEWFAGYNSSIIVNTYGTTYDTVAAVFTGEKGDLDELDCNDDVDLCNQTILLGQAASGECRSFCIDGAQGAQAAGCVCQVGSETAGGCCLTGSTAGASCCPIMAVNGTAGQNPECTAPWSQVQFDAWAGQSYYILVASSEDRGGKLKLELSEKSDAQSADSCTSPAFLSPLNFIGDQNLYHISTMNASFFDDSGVSAAGGVCDSVDPNVSCAGTYGASVWFTYTPESHQLVTFDALDSSYPNFIAVYDNSNGSGEVGCSLNDTLQVQLKEGHKYLILVGSTDEDNGYQGGKLKLSYLLKDQLGGDIFGTGAGVTDQGIPDSITCYQVRQARHSNETENIWDQFSLRQQDYSWTLIIGGVDTVCVPSNKETCTRYDYDFPWLTGEAAELCQSKSCGTSAGPDARGEAAQICGG
jgi:hypothetical protein